GSRLHCTHHPFTQVTRIGLRHGHLPNHHSRRLADPQAFVNPDCFASDSSRADYALISSSSISMRLSRSARVAATPLASKRCVISWEQFASHAETVKRITCSGRAL